MLRLVQKAHNKFVPTDFSNSRFNRLILLIATTVTFLLALSFLVVQREHVRHRFHISRPAEDHGPKQWCPPESFSNETMVPIVEDISHQINTSSKLPPSVLPPRKGDKQRLLEARKFVKAILDPDNKEFRRYDCLSLTPTTKSRYAYLRKPSATSGAIRPKYFFALDLYQIADVLPQLLGSLIEAIKFLGPHNCVLSIVEGRSTDGTYEILRELGKEFEALGLRYFLQTSDLHPQMNGDRIVLLSELRNLALRDIYEQPQSYAPDTTIIFSNDIWLCTEDVLELVHQHFTQESYMTCAMDWNLNPGGHPRYYDAWVGRSMTGNSYYKNFFEQEKGMFWDDRPTNKRFESWQPVQVFACWNGITALTAQPFMNGTIRFRGVEYDKEECFQGEPGLLAKDLWFNGYGRIAVVPTINTAYYYDHMEIVRREKGSVSEHLCHSDVEKIVWKTEPPKKVKCKPSWEHKDTWVPWDQGLRVCDPESTKC
ncbi:hypothetical protein N0V90_012564 [Kalmusia sp. IMI 367209]|nr:hypothetical protein N0V90_012564 [Kalmusia sp. IMI 367209]